jgi:glycosyltransferase involved in cell wall biosynthesis
MPGFFRLPAFFPPRLERVSLPARTPQSRGKIVLSYLTAPFLEKSGSAGPRGHTNWQECRVMVESWREAGFAVEVVPATDARYVPSDDAFALIDIHANLERWRDHPAPVKILHATGAHWLTQNRAELERLEALRNRRGVSLVPRRAAAPSRGAECATVITYLGNDFTAGTFRFAQKPLHRVPLSSAYEFSFPEKKDWATARRRFLWLGSYGMVHKGLDLVLEAFADNPDLHLTICGRPEKEADFFETYRKELTALPNIHLAGWTDPASPEFESLRQTHGFCVYPSCSEGGGGSLIHCMHAGLVPLATHEASVDLGSAGILIPEGTVSEVSRKVREAAALSPTELQHRAEQIWQSVRQNHTLSQFQTCYANLVKEMVHAR